MTENPQDQPTEGEQQPYSGQPTPPPPPPPPGQAPAYGQQAQAPVSPSDARTWSMLTHIGGIFFGFIPGLIVYLVYKDRDPFLRRHAVQALNFQIIITITYVVSSILSATFILAIIGLPLLMVAWIASIVFSILAAMAANKGEEYTYPMVPQMVT